MYILYMYMYKILLCSTIINIVVKERYKKLLIQVFKDFIIFRAQPRLEPG